jgi:hypothetical protein
LSAHNTSAKKRSRISPMIGFITAELVWTDKISPTRRM